MDNNEFLIDPQEATTFALLYGLPLLSWHKLYAPIVQKFGANTWRHSRNLATALSRIVVRPNVDTLYSTLIFDLSQSNIEITIPDVLEDTFKLFSFFDPYGGNFANVGTGGFYRSGKYLVTHSDGRSSQAGLNGTDSASSDYVGCISSPTFYGTLLVRWGVDPMNQDDVHRWQDQCKINVCATFKKSRADKVPLLEFLTKLYDPSKSSAENVLHLLPHFAPVTAPFATLAAAGIANGVYTTQQSVSLTSAYDAATSMAAAAAKDPESSLTLNDGWTALNTDLVGAYGEHYALRAAVAMSAYLALRHPFAVYPSWNDPSTKDQKLTLGAKEALVITFSGKPLIQKGGFWSLTAYDSDNFLIPNNRGIYALGDRSAINSPDCKSVYGEGAGDDEPFRILVQPADLPPPPEWANNWISAPAGGGQVSLQLRFYVAEKSMLDGSYVYPRMEKISAIVA